MIIYNELTNVPFFTMAITTARIHQAVISSAAQVITIALILFYECRVPAQFLPNWKSSDTQSNPMNKLNDKNLTPGKLIVHNT
jgi:hypothetical protein